MGLFSKKETKKNYDSLPELPQLPKNLTSPQNYSDSMNRMERRPTFAKIPATALPAFPKTDNGNHWSMQAVKDAVGDGPSQEYYSEDEESKYMPEKYPQEYNSHSELSSGDKEVKGMPRTQNYAPKMQKQPLFVRIDKFESAIRDFQDIQSRVKQIEELISAIKELRMKEDREFREWEKDLQILKERMDNIDRTLFESLD